MGRYRRQSNKLHLSATRKRKSGENLRSYWKRKRENDEITEGNLFTEPSQVEHTFEISGRRIVDISFFIKQLQTLNDHSSLDCDLSQMVIISEKRMGFRSCILFECKMCHFKKGIWTDDNEDNGKNINSDIVVGMMSIGSGFSNMEELFSTADIPSLSSKTYANEHAKVSKAWELAAEKEMLKAADEEKRMAIEHGEVDADGTPLLTVVADGSWAKRSYRTNYTSLSGVAAIVGYYTKKVLFMGVKNKYCSICIRGERNNSMIQKHDCYRNWQGSSSGMEASIIVEGFKQSMEMYGAKYWRLIGDGDSNVYKKILDARPYHNLLIQKIECKNHLLRNMCSKLRDIVRNSKCGPCNLRKELGSRILKIRQAIISAIRYRKKESLPQNEIIRNLRSDILNSPMHIFGDHQKCASYFCKNNESKNFVPELKTCGLLYKILDVINHLSDNAKSLLFDATNNSVEELNGKVAKYIGGKRINFCMRQSYQARCKAASLSHNTKTPKRELFLALHGKSPGAHTKQLEKKRSIKNENRFKRRKKNLLPRRLFSSEKLNKSEDKKNYGCKAQKPDLPQEEYEIKKNEFLKNLEMTEEDRMKLFEQTLQQRDCPVWYEERRKRLTASYFGQVCSKRDDTGCENLVKSILYRNFNTDAFNYGRTHEKDALNHLKDHFNIKVKPSGLFIDKDCPYLGATPDGLIEEDGLVEIKCPMSCHMISPEEAISSRKFTFWTYDKKQEKIGNINKKHQYYFQMQGQLHISQRKYCLFVLWTKQGVKIQKILKDDIFWENNMKQKLKSFYMDCLLPELVDPRHVRSMPIRNPQYILAAQKKKKGSTTV